VTSSQKLIMGKYRNGMMYGNAQHIVRVSIKRTVLRKFNQQTPGAMTPNRDFLGIMYISFPSNATCDMQLAHLRHAGPAHSVP